MSIAGRNFEKVRSAREFVFTILESAFFLALLKLLSTSAESISINVAYLFGYGLTLLYVLFAGDRFVEIMMGTTEGAIQGKWAKFGFRSLTRLCAAGFAVFTISLIEAALQAEIAKLGM